VELNFLAVAEDDHIAAGNLGQFVGDIQHGPGLDAGNFVIGPILALEQVIGVAGHAQTVQQAAPERIGMIPPLMINPAPKGRAKMARRRRRLALIPRTGAINNFVQIAGADQRLLQQSPLAPVAPDPDRSVVRIKIIHLLSVAVFTPE